MSRLLTIAAALLLLLPAAATAQANPEPQASLPDIEDEVMCTICGTALQLSDSPQAERERAFINDLIAKGKTKDEIKDALVDEYGPAVLAVPDGKGFDLTAWILPGLGLLVALIAIGLAAMRWRRAGAAAAETRDEAALSDIDREDAERLQADIGRYQV
ncbi:MAG: cytochrome c-type biogenesis protein CcmH [Solirubrobacterales bacterium]|nr:cytochrome c-type biogenesis protein CcmH [Acidobacteriota bacterium]MCB8969573.1 cytochrome c-type biogenesis protein CcmH [Thermoleophilales bacterium]MCO5326630.1 cytochrome c-type biogenesis protein CcmH [Solirubrobacterales bacterium]